MKDHRKIHMIHIAKSDNITSKQVFVARLWFKLIWWLCPIMIIVIHRKSKKRIWSANDDTKAMKMWRTMSKNGIYSVKHVCIVAVFRATNAFYLDTQKYNAFLRHYVPCTLIVCLHSDRLTHRQLALWRFSECYTFNKIKSTQWVK